MFLFHCVGSPKLTVIPVSVPAGGSQDPGAAHPLPHHAGQNQGEVRQGIRGQRARAGVVQQGGRRPQPVPGRRGEAADELKHQAAADGRQQERIRQPAAEN